MNSSGRYILFIGLIIGYAGVLYFLFLLLHLPILVSTVLIVSAIFGTIRWFSRSAQHQRISKLALIILLAGVSILINKTYYLSTRYGLWDAWSIWNLNAQYLSDPVNWQKLFQNATHTHPDYPMALPSVIAFFCRLVGQFHLLIPYAIHFLIMLCIPVLIYLETYRRSIIVAGLSVILFAVNEFYLTMGISQLADTMLGFFFLCALVCLEQGKEDRRMLILSAAFIGCCMWTKNEGIMLGFVFLTFNLRIFLATEHLKYFIGGIALPLTTLLIFKLAYAPANDLVVAQGKATYQLLFEPERYKLIYNSFTYNLSHYFNELKYGILIYALICVLKREWPINHVTMILVCMAGYLLIYVLSPYDLEWHLNTSLSRLMLQLMPATMYILAQRFSKSTTSFQARFVSIQRRPL